MTSVPLTGQIVQHFKEELKLADDDVQDYLQQVGSFPLLSKEEELELAHQVRAGNARARERMAECNLRLVVSIAKVYKDRGIEFIDLIQEGNAGLMKAIAKFDPDLGNRFSTYATHWIKQGILRAIEEKSNLIKVPVWANGLLRQYFEQRRVMLADSGIDPEVDDVLAAMGVIETDARAIKDALHARRADTRMHLTSSEGEPDLNTLSQIEAEPEEEGFFLSGIDRALELVVTDHERHVLEERFGLNGKRARTLEAIGEDLDPPVSRERVRQVQAVAMDKIRLFLAD
jgi:RNA polymerase primary sigma factor